MVTLECVPCKHCLFFPSFQSLSISKRTRLELSENPRKRAVAKRVPSGVSPELVNSRLSANLRRTAKDGSKRIKKSTARLGSTTTHKRPPSRSNLRTPRTEQVTAHPSHANNACNFVDSVIHLCNKSTASCGEIGTPVGGEDMFLLLIRTCGVIEAKYWADALGLPNEKSYSLLSTLLYGPGRKD